MNFYTTGNTDVQMPLKKEKKRNRGVIIKPVSIRCDLHLHHAARHISFA
jgi:hypothetical protein